MQLQDEDFTLPAGFQPLEKYVQKWAGWTTQVRWNQRATASMAEIQGFYDVMLEHADAALAYLERKPIGALSPSEGRLMRLLLALANCSIAVELHKQPRAPHSPFPHGVTVVRGGFPFG